MKRACVLLFFALFSAAPVTAEEPPIFGPVQYNVKARYGKENRYKETFQAAEGSYLIKLQNGARQSERPDVVQFSINGETLMPEGRYDYGFFACFVKLRKENTFEVVLKDEKPGTFKRPPARPRNFTVTVMQDPFKLAKGVLGLQTWEGLKDYAGSLLKIKSSEAASLAFTAANWQNNVATRGDAMRKLSDQKDPAARDFLLHVFDDYSDKQEVRGEAALALGILGDKTAIPPLMRGVLDPEEQVRLGSARALSRYKEEDTKELLAKTLATLDDMRTTAVVRSIVSAGWRPVSTLIRLAESSDPPTANLGVELLVGSSDPRVVELMLKYLKNPGSRDTRRIIAALGESKDRRAIEPLITIASDPVKRREWEAELGMALADLGDQKAVGPIIDMINKTEREQTYYKLRGAYKKLTGKEFIEK